MTRLRILTSATWAAVSSFEVGFLLSLLCARRWLSTKFLICTRRFIL